MEKTEKKKPNWKRLLKVVLIVVAALAVIELCALGWLGNMGPLKFLYDVRFGMLPGNSETYGFDRIAPMENSPLQGKNICVLGSSVTYGMTSQQTAIAEYLGARFGCTYTKEAVSGTTLADIGSTSYVQRMLKKIDPKTHYDLFVCQLSTNDASKKLPLGTVAEGSALTDFDTSTVTGAMEYVIVYAKQTWNCPVIFFTNCRYDSDEYAAMVSRLFELQDKYGIGVIDLWSDDGFNAITAEQRSLYMNDRIHPTKAGYRDWWGPELDRQLSAFLSQ